MQELIAGAILFASSTHSRAAGNAKAEITEIEKQALAAATADELVGFYDQNVNWGSVLEKLPKQFKASDIRTVRAVKDKRSSELFKAISRWMEAGTVKRKDRGRYERVK